MAEIDDSMADISGWYVVHKHPNAPFSADLFICLLSYLIVSIFG